MRAFKEEERSVLISVKRITGYEKTVSTIGIMLCQERMVLYVSEGSNHVTAT